MYYYLCQLYTLSVLPRGPGRALHCGPEASSRPRALGVQPAETVLTAAMLETARAAVDDALPAATDAGTLRRQNSSGSTMSGMISLLSNTGGNTVSGNGTMREASKAVGGGGQR
jgi:hypothetical protein